MDIKEAMVCIERCLIYWNAGASHSIDKRALELLLDYTKEALKTSHNKRVMPCEHEISEKYICVKCGGIVTAKFD